jgi:hypothetical protein
MGENGVWVTSRVTLTAGGEGEGREPFGNYVVRSGRSLWSVGKRQEAKDRLHGVDWKSWE